MTTGTTTERTPAGHYEGRHLVHAALLRDAPRWERVLRIALSLVVVAYGVLALLDYHARPREVDTNPFNPYALLLSEANAGRVDRVDDDGSRVLFRSTDGALYRFDRRHDGVDVRAAVERQPYVRQHAGAVTYGPLSRTEWSEHGAVVALVSVVGLAVIWRIVTGPYPRVATRWAWFWIVGTGIGVVAYLLLAGSWVREGRTYDRVRVTGTPALLLAILVNGIGVWGGGAIHDARHPERDLGAYVQAPAAPA